MKVGVAPGSFRPESGGGYTFVAEVLDALRRAAPASRHRFVVFSDPAVAERAPAAANLRFSALRPSALRDGLHALRYYSPLLGRLLGARSSLECAALREQVDVMWFPGGQGVVLDLPYFATVWDVQHRTHPWFPEVSADAQWLKREQVHRELLRRAAGVITGTAVGAEQLGFFYQVPRERIHLLPHPAPRPVAAPAQPSAAVSPLQGERFFFYPAQFWAHKNHVGLLQALKILADRHGLKPQLALTGSDKGNRAHVERTARELGVLQQVRFLGFVSSGDLAWLYRHAVALVYPAFSGPENLPPLEAFSHGCPVALARYPGAAEQAGEAALLFDPHDPAQIAEALATLAGQPEARSRLIARGHERLHGRTSDAFVAGALAMLDDFEAVRRCWA